MPTDSTNLGQSELCHRLDCQDGSDAKAHQETVILQLCDHVVVMTGDTIYHQFSKSRTLFNVNIDKISQTTAFYLFYCLKSNIKDTIFVQYYTHKITSEISE